MEAISLKKVTAVVVVFTMGAFLANANANDAKNIEVKSAEAVTTVAEVVSQVGNFDALIKQYDKDNNGLLSQAELEASGKKILINAFSHIDKNADLGVSEEEFNQYLALENK